MHMHMHTHHIHMHMPHARHMHATCTPHARHMHATCTPRARHVHRCVSASDHPVTGLALIYGFILFSVVLLLNMIIGE